nr:MAG TPA: hypothetical protein [Caudoviricetes sp.]
MNRIESKNSGSPALGFLLGLECFSFYFCAGRTMPHVGRRTAWLFSETLFYE